MTIARTTGALLGTDESTGVTIAAAGNSAGAETDLLGAASTGMLNLYLVFTPATAPTTGNVVVTLQSSRAITKLYQDPGKRWSYGALGRDSSQQKLFLGKVPSCRYETATVFNNSDVQLNNVAVLYELEKTT